MTDTSCVCKCEDGFFGPQCDRTGTAACTNLDAENSLLSGGDIMYIEVQHVYTSDAVKCHFYAQSPATGRLITHATGAQVVASTEQCLALYGTAICEYSAIRCRTPPNDWVGYHLDATNWRAVYEIHLKISTDMRFNFGQTACMWNYAANCYTSFLGDGYAKMDILSIKLISMQVIRAIVSVVVKSSVVIGYNLMIVIWV
eukprot:TRINITY_DN44_c0_g1_i8.p1 TRINITY_DN44_c0_g1~~TRINITY_DN44_c0_g1_i8.p1  ORF type:complete len:207 (-),score=19.39 TRINITY_DN44_c0_g1_i8:712-1311(-)